MLWGKKDFRSVNKINIIALLHSGCIRSECFTLYVHEACCLALLLQRMPSTVLEHLYTGWEELQPSSFLNTERFLREGRSCGFAFIQKNKVFLNVVWWIDNLACFKKTKTKNPPRRVMTAHLGCQR